MNNQVLRQYSYSSTKLEGSSRCLEVYRRGGVEYKMKITKVRMITNTKKKTKVMNHVKANNERKI